jgi:hypothetical protein
LTNPAAVSQLWVRFKAPKEENLEHITLVVTTNYDLDSRNRLGDLEGKTSQIKPN